MQDEEIGPLESALESLRILGVAKEEWERYLSATFLVLRGWAGMVRQIEARGDRVVRPVPQGSLVEFLAIRLLLDRFAVAYTARTSLGIETPVREFCAWPAGGSIHNGRTASNSGPSLCSNWPRSPVCHLMSSTA